MAYTVRMIRKSRRAGMLICMMIVFSAAASLCTGQPEGFPEHHAMPYHGMRMMRSAGVFEVRRLQIRQASAGNIQVDILFSGPVDPRTVVPASVKMNGIALPETTLVQFNRAGNAMRLVLPLEFEVVDAQVITLELFDIKSFNGTALTRTGFDGLTGSCMRVFGSEEHNGNVR